MRCPWEAWALGGAVAAWIAGFDFFYSLFDREIDQQQGLHSVAVRFGVRGAFWGARLLHVLTVVLLAAAGLGLELGWLYWLGVGVVALLLAYEHSLVRPDDLRRLDAAFFTVNGVISVVFFLFVLAEVTLYRRGRSGRRSTATRRCARRVPRGPGCPSRNRRRRSRSSSSSGRHQKRSPNTCPQRSYFPLKLCA